MFFRVTCSCQNIRLTALQNVCCTRCDIQNSYQANQSANCHHDRASVVICRVLKLLITFGHKSIWNSNANITDIREPKRLCVVCIRVESRSNGKSKCRNSNNFEPSFFIEKQRASTNDTTYQSLLKKFTNFKQLLLSFQQRNVEMFGRSWDYWRVI